MRRLRAAAAGQSGVGVLGLGFVVSLLVSGATVGLRNGRFERADVDQPVAFNHRLHVEQEAIECSMCHPHYQTETFSGLPEAGLCALCHPTALGDSPQELRLVALLEQGQPLEWVPLFEQPPHVFYSHRRHVAVAGIACETCHGDLGSSEVPPRRVRPLRMGDCMDCHEREGASLDCSACHR